MPPPQKHARVPILCLLCRRPTSPSSSAQARPPRLPLRKNTKATGKLLVLALTAKRKTHGACLAPRTEATDAYAPVSFFMRAAFPGRQSPRRARASQDDASRKESFCQPSFNAAGAGNPLWHNYPTPVIQFIPFLHLCQRFSFRFFTYSNRINIF